MTHRIPLGPFVLHRRIGRGGMGEVWEGLHVPQQIPVAVKILTRRGVRRDTFIEAFRNEVRAAAGLNHPRIVTVLDYGEMPAGAARLSDDLFAANSPYIVMEHARRGSLKRYVNAIGWQELKAVLFTILDALAHAHACGVIHRDLKPGNILVGCGADDALGIKLTDFGLAHAVDQHEFGGKFDSGWGTPQFMAPEQFRAAWRDYGPWTDLYALGIMAYYLAVGDYPFQADDTAGYARAHQLGTPRPFEPRFEVPAGYARWVMKLMQKRPADRFRYAADAAWALQGLIDPEATERRRDTVSMLPIKGARARWMTDAKIEALGATAKWRKVDDDSATILERPQTTELVSVDVSEDSLPSLTVGTDELWKEFSETSPESSTPAPRHFREAPPFPTAWKRPEVKAASPKLLGAGLGLFGLRTLPMVDREPERDFLWEMLGDVRDVGRARAAIIRGPAGTGKTRLARWLCQRAHEVGAATISTAMFSPIAGPGDGLSRMVAKQLRAGGMSYQGTIDRVEHELASLGVRDPVEISAMAEFVMPVGVATAEHRSLSIRMQGPNHRYGLLLRYLERLTHERPAIVWFDDIQWGADALAFVQYVLERQHHVEVPILFVMTLRNEALVDRAVETELLADIALNRRSRVLDVEPLEDRDTAQLVRELLFLAPELADEVERRCGGNPLFAVQLVGDWVAGGKLRFGSDGFELRPGVKADIPDDLHAIWRDRLELLLRKRSTEDLIALEVAAALGTSVELEEWYTACSEFGVSSPPGLTRELLELGLASLAEYGFDFCHGLFRESLERSATDNGRWEPINAACVRMLQRCYPNREFPYSERYARHVIEAGAPNHAIDPLLEAARARIDRSDFQIALATLDQRVEILDDYGFDDSARERCDGWLMRAEASLWQGHYDDTERLASRAAVQARRKQWSETLARATLMEAHSHLFRRDLDRAERLFERARTELLELRDEAGHGQCLHGLGRVEHARGNLSEAEAHFEHARAIMTRVGDRLGEAQCLNALGDLERDRENWDAALGHSRNAMRIFEQRNNTVGVADCVNDIAELHRFRGELERAEEECGKALRLYEAVGSEHSMHVLTNLALTMSARGEFAQAREILEEVFERFEETEQDVPMASIALVLLPVLLELGEYDLARRQFSRASTITRQATVRGRDVIDAVTRAASLVRAEPRWDSSFADELEKLADQMTG